MLARNLVHLRPRSEQVYTSQNRTVLVTGLDGCIGEGTDQGVYVHQTRMLSLYRYLIDGRPPKTVVNSNIEQHSWLGYYIVVPPGSAETDAAQHSLELRLSRLVGDGFREQVDLANFTRQPTSFTLELELDADFADQQEAGGERLTRGELRREWREAGEGRWELAFEYRAEHGTARLDRGLIVAVERASSPPSHSGRAIRFQIELPPQGRWHASIEAIPLLEHAPLRNGPSLDVRRFEFLNGASSFSTAESGTLAPVVAATLEQARRDLAALRLYDLDRHERAWVPAAGLPVYVALFGRDSLTAAWQAGLLSSAMMEGTLAAHVDWQAREMCDWRDEQPGNMMHQANTGPLAVLNYNPLGRYYGGMTAAGFYAFVVSSLWHWTGDKELVVPFLEPALRALQWRDTYADLLGDGFSWYRTRSPQGLENQGWKDSGDAIVYPDGSQASAPIAPCEEQGYEYVAKLRIAEVLWWLGEKDAARRLFREAAELKKRFNDAYWMEDEGFVAMALDSHGRQIRSIASNAGHCLATAILDESLARRVAGRLMADDLFSGWGIRTLSSRHPAYNPYAYHRGTVWPVEQGTFALGFLRYGFHDCVQRLARAQFEAACLFEFYRLPECFAGHPRDREHPFPAIYPRANSPQAWSSSSVFCLMQALLGLYPYAPLNVLFVDPHLPDWLPEITLRNLHVGEAVAQIRFFRKSGGASDYRVEDVRGTLHVIRQPSPWSLTAGLGERLRDLVTSL